MLIEPDLRLGLMPRITIRLVATHNSQYQKSRAHFGRPEAISVKS